MDTEKTKQVGALQASLDRNSNKIRSDRAKTIADTARLKFRRKVEDIAMRLSELSANREALLDMSPDNAMSIINATNFNAEEFVNKMSDVAEQIFKTNMQLNILKEEYSRLFGEEVNVNI